MTTPNSFYALHSSSLILKFEYFFWNIKYDKREIKKALWIASAENHDLVIIMKDKFVITSFNKRSVNRLNAKNICRKCIQFQIITTINMLL